MKPPAVSLNLSFHANYLSQCPCSPAPPVVLDSASSPAKCITGGAGTGCTPGPHVSEAPLRPDNCNHKYDNYQTRNWERYLQLIIFFQMCDESINKFIAVCQLFCNVKKTVYLFLIFLLSHNMHAMRTLYFYSVPI